MIEAARKAGVVFSVVHNYTRSPVIGRLLELVQQGTIGQPYLVRLENLSHSHFPGATAYDPGWRTRAARGGGGALLDNGYHSIYMARYVMQSPVVAVYAVTGTYARPIEVEDTAVVIYRHANGGISSIQAGWGADASTRANEVQGSQGSILFHQAEHPLAVCKGGQWEYPEPWPAKPSAFARVFSAFLDALDGKGPVPTTPEDALLNLRLVLAAYEASRTGKVVDVAG
jgi:predicted dehydrogenase